MLPASWRTYLPSVYIAASRYGVDPAIVLAVIGTESSFNPKAFKQEPNDASYGLMQVLFGTAKGLGYTGTTAGLFDPVTSIDLGTKLLGQNLRARGGDVDAAVSQYNGGYRPTYGFGKRFPNGTFGNQAHVDRFNRWLGEVRQALTAVPSGPPTGGSGTPPPSSPPSMSLSPWWIAAGLLAGWFLWKGIR